MAVIHAQWKATHLRTYREYKLDLMVTKRTAKKKKEDTKLSGWEGRVEGVGEGDDDHNILCKILKLRILKKQ